MVVVVVVVVIDVAIVVAVVVVDDDVVEVPSHICRRKQKAILKLSKNFEKRFRTQNLEQIFVIRKTHRQPRIRLKVGTKSYRPIIKSLEKSFYGYVLPFLSWPKQHFLMSCKKKLVKVLFCFLFPDRK